MNSTLSREIINLKAEMFMALNFCPTDGITYYDKIIYGDGPNSRILVLSMNLIKKTVGELKTVALEIFSKISAILKLSYIQAGKRDPQNKNIELQINETAVKGKIER